jgi:hypothetical protein
MYPHRLRLRGPWDCEPLERRPPGPLPPPRRVTLPGRWTAFGLADFAGRVLFRRRFGCPSNVDADERVWLTGAGVADRAAVTLNGVLLDASVGPSAFEIEVTPLLRTRNELLLEVEGGPDGGPWGEVALEVRRIAYLRAIAVETRPLPDGVELTVTGMVVGTSDRSLELYVVAGRGTVAYAGTTPTPAGTPFRLTATIAAEAGPTIQVDLVGGAEVWYTWRGDCCANAPPAG